MIDPLAAVFATALPAYGPFMQPLPVWDYWVWLLLPLSLAISLVYKSVRVDPMRRVPLEAVRLALWIVTIMAAAAVALLLLVALLSR